MSCSIEASADTLDLPEGKLSIVGPSGMAECWDTCLASHSEAWEQIHPRFDMYHGKSKIGYDPSKMT